MWPKLGAFRYERPGADGSLYDFRYEGAEKLGAFRYEGLAADESL